MRHKFLAILFSATLVVVLAPSSQALLRSEQIPFVFAELTNAKALANPSMILIDLSNGQTIYGRGADELRKPASTLKLMSAFSALEYLPENKQFRTTIYATDIQNTFQIVGDFDPSITPSAKLSKNLKFVNSDTFVGQIRKVAKRKYLKIRYYGITSRTKTNMNNSFRRVGYHITWENISQDKSTSHATKVLYSATSPLLPDILNYTLLFSDNWVADYLAKSAAVAAGFGYNSAGIFAVFNEVLVKYNIAAGKFQAVDGSGLSQENRISAQTLAQVLVTMKKSPKFAPAINGLPVGGISGTLQHRFLKSAPEAVGLVRAKTGSISGVVSLAGYVESGNHEYVFAIIADHLAHNYLTESAARAAIDNLLGKIASPLQIAPEVTPTPSPESSAA